jgi:hypothetical protein
MSFEEPIKLNWDDIVDRTERASALKRWQAIADRGDVDPTLLWLLRRAGQDFGPLGVARVAAELCGHHLLSTEELERTRPLWKQMEEADSRASSVDENFNRLLFNDLKKRVDRIAESSRDWLKNQDAAVSDLQKRVEKLERLLIQEGLVPVVEDLLPIRTEPAQDSALERLVHSIDDRVMVLEGRTPPQNMQDAQRAHEEAWRAGQVLVDAPDTFTTKEGETHPDWSQDPDPDIRAGQPPTEKVQIQVGSLGHVTATEDEQSDKDDSDMNEYMAETLTAWGKTISMQMRDPGLLSGDGLQAHLDAGTAPPTENTLILHHVDGAPRSPENYHPYVIPAADARILRDLLNAATDRGVL